QQQRTAATQPGGIVTSGSGQSGRPFATVRGQEVEELERPPLAAQGAQGAGPPVAEERDAHPVEVSQPQVGEGCSRPACEVELVWVAEVHGARSIHEHVDGHVLLLDEELDEELLQACVHVPVELAEVVPGGVVAVVSELDALAAPDAAPLALHAAGGQPARGELELFEAPQECLVEERRALAGELGRRGHWPSAAAVSQPARWASRRGWRGPRSRS